jgi:hypothetical protein
MSAFRIVHLSLHPVLSARDLPRCQVMLLCILRLCCLLAWLFRGTPAAVVPRGTDVHPPPCGSAMALPSCPVSRAHHHILPPSSPHLMMITTWLRRQHVCVKAHTLIYDGGWAYWALGLPLNACRERGRGTSILAMLCPAVASMHVVLHQAAADVCLPDSTPRRLRVWLYTSPPSMPHTCTAPPCTSVRLVGWLAACLVDYS